MDKIAIKENTLERLKDKGVVLTETTTEDVSKIISKINNSNVAFARLNESDNTVVVKQCLNG